MGNWPDHYSTLISLLVTRVDPSSSRRWNFSSLYTRVSRLTLDGVRSFVYAFEARSMSLWSISNAPWAISYNLLRWWAQYPCFTCIGYKRFIKGTKLQKGIKSYIIKSKKCNMFVVMILCGVVVLNNNQYVVSPYLASPLSQIKTKTSKRSRYSFCPNLPWLQTVISSMARDANSITTTWKWPLQRLPFTKVENFVFLGCCYTKDFVLFIKMRFCFIASTTLQKIFS